MKEKGRTVVGWEEVFMRGKVSTPIVGVMWHNVDDTLKARVEGHRSIIAPVTHLYFDFPERKDKREIKAATWMPAVPLKKTYETTVLPRLRYLAYKAATGAISLYTAQYYKNCRNSMKTAPNAMRNILCFHASLHYRNWDGRAKLTGISPTTNAAWQRTIRASLLPAYTIACRSL